MLQSQKLNLSIEIKLLLMLIVLSIEIIIMLTIMKRHVLMRWCIQIHIQRQKPIIH